MLIGYEFVNLTPEQVQQRRAILDRQGHMGFLVPVVILATVYMVRRISSFSFWKTGSRIVEQALLPTDAAKGAMRRLNWYLSSSTTVTTREYGNIQVQLAATLYLGYLFFIAIRNTAPDYMHVTKAFGHVAVSQLPVHYLLSVKSPLSPITHATGLTHESLNTFHRLLGRMVATLLSLHAVLYLNFFYQINVIGKRLGDRDVQLGLAALTTVGMAAGLAYPAIRQRLYHAVFFRSHVLLSMVLPVLVWFHQGYTPTRVYAAMASMIWIVNGVLRQEASQKITAHLEDLGVGLVDVVCLTEGKRWKRAAVGSHGYVCCDGLGPRCPFSVVAVTEVDKGDGCEVRFVVKESGGPMTSRLARAAKNCETLKLALEGPYGQAEWYMPTLLKDTKRNIEIFAGGVGATYALPIYAALHRARRGTLGLSLTWVVQTADQATWGIDLLRDLEHPINVEIYVTHNSGQAERKGHNSASWVDIKGLVVHSNRPNLKTVVSNFFSGQGGSKKSVPRPTSKGDHGGGSDLYLHPDTVVVCGPHRLTKQLRREVGEHACDSGARIEWYEDQFGFGGS